MTQLLPPKKEVALALLERSNVDIYLDPRAEGVVVPPQFRKEPRLILKIGLNMPVPIPDLRLDDESMSCTLSFNRAKFFCIVPWSSVFAMVGDDGRGMVWPDDVPQELAVKTEDQPRAPGGLAEVPMPPSSRSGVKGGKPRLAPSPTPLEEVVAESDRGSVKKRGGKKKKEEAAPRPMLRAVPNAPPSAPHLDKVDKLEKAEKPEKAEDAGREEKAAPAPSPPAPARPNAPGRPKRELPPYLRVVK